MILHDYDCTVYRVYLKLWYTHCGEIVSFATLKYVNFFPPTNYLGTGYLGGFIKIRVTTEVVSKLCNIDILNKYFISTWPILLPQGIPKICSRNI